MQHIRILLVDDHQVIRDGVRSYFTHNERYKVVGDASNGQEALDWLQNNPADVVVTDISMPQLDGVELTQQIRENYPNTKVIALTMLDEYQPIKRMLEAGASGYLLKNSGAGELLKALDVVLEGEVYQEPAIQRVIMSYMTRKSRIQEDVATRVTVEMELTTREIEILKLIVAEKTNREIADELFISIRTVDSHKRNILEKTGARNSVGLVRYALSKGYMD